MVSVLSTLTSLPEVIISLSYVQGFLLIVSVNLCRMQTLNKESQTLEDGGITGTETFKIGCKEWADEVVCSWTLRAVWWEDIRELCEEVGLVVQQEFRSFGDALCGRTADANESGDGGRIFVIQRQC